MEILNKYNYINFNSMYDVYSNSKIYYIQFIN